jgi:hypothetical protein
MALTATQLALLRENSHLAKVAVEFAEPVSTTYRYVSGLDPWTDGSSNLYTPRPIECSVLSLANPSKSTATIKIADQDATLKTKNYTSRFSGQDIVVTFLLQSTNAGGIAPTWTDVATVSWVIKNMEGNSEGWITFNLSAASGMSPRAGLIVGNRAEFEFAPAAGETFKVGNGTAGVPDSSESCVYYRDDNGRLIRWCF